VRGLKINVQGCQDLAMKIYVQYKEGDDPDAHWRQQVTLPKKWLTSTCDRLKLYLIENYNKARPSSSPLVPEEWHLKNEGDGRCESLGSENLIEDVVGDFDDVFLRPGSSIEQTKWRRSDTKLARPATMPVLVPIEFEHLMELREAVNTDNPKALKMAVENADIASPHELLMSETDVKDADGRICGTEWHSVGGRFAWDLEDSGRGEDPSAKMTLTEYARRRGADRVLKLISIADHCSTPIVGSSRGRTVDDIEASAATVKDKMGEMNSQLRASLEAKNGS